MSCRVVSSSYFPALLCIPTAYSIGLQCNLEFLPVFSNSSKLFSSLVQPDTAPSLCVYPRGKLRMPANPATTPLFTSETLDPSTSRYLFTFTATSQNLFFCSPRRKICVAGINTDYTYTTTLNSPLPMSFCNVINSFIALVHTRQNWFPGSLCGKIATRSVSIHRTL
jgi:hypothetical protein